MDASKLTREQVLALKARAFDRLMDSIPTVANGHRGDEKAAEEAQEILALPVPPPPAAEDT